MKTRMVWVELASSLPIRIFKSEKAAFAAPSCTVTEMPYREAVSIIRHTLWLTCGGQCADCSAPITEDTAHMHERKHRGQLGEISLENSVMICEPCHKFAHKNRNPQWTKKT